MKKTIIILAMLMMLCTSVAAADWAYAGRFVLRTDMPHATDVMILNHLQRWNGQPIGGYHGQYMPYDVYYKHDHSTDEGTGKKEYADWSFIISSAIVPLNAYGKPMDYEGLHCGTIITTARIGTRGAWDVETKSFRVFDRKSNSILFEALGQMGNEQLYKNTAAEVILKMSAPHPVPVFSTAASINGTGYYYYR